jgi:elongation factor 1-beta
MKKVAQPRQKGKCVRENRRLSSMGTMLITIKIMPSSAEADLEKLGQKVKQIIESKQGQRPSFKQEPIAFGLKALIVSFDLDESLEIDPIEQELEKLENINSTQITDMRRAFG